ncbi:MAG: Flp pilus assembly complex ATPase component TadA [Fibrobacter sp.]|nr:Flp pilus assembly complex ATPase component TadA [Fibrobacter sp.]
MATEIESLLEYALNVGASELIVTEGAPSAVRLAGKVCSIPDAPAIAVGGLREILSSMDGESGTVMGSWCGSKWRVRYYRAALGNAAVFRPVLEDCPEFSSIGAPESINSLLDVSSGLIVFAGPACSGKTTTATSYLSAICQSKILRVSFLNAEKEIPVKCDPCLVLKDDSGDIEQKVEQALRSGTDVIWLGDFDGQALIPVLHAAEAGALVVLNVTAGNSVGVIDTLISAVSTENRDLVRNMLASVLKAIVVQRLLPSTQGGSTAAWEVLFGTQNVAAKIRGGEHFTLPSILSASAADGMMLMDDCIIQLVNAGYVSSEDASRYVANSALLG